MKSLPVRFALFAFTTIILRGAPIAADSHITAVTVYADRAVVTRTATLDLAATGPVEVTFGQLPAPLLDASLQVAGHGTAETTLLDVTARPTFVDFTPNERVKAIEDDLRALARQDRTLTDRASVLNQQRDYVVKIQGATTAPPKDGAGTPPAVDTWTKLLAFSEDQLGKIATELASIDTQREDLQARRTALEQQLNELRGQGGRSYKTVAVRLTAATAGRLELTLRYTVPGPSWFPSYDARVATADHAVQLGYFGQVRQNSGEDWKDVELTLSTARPSLGGGAPELQPWIVQQQQMVPVAMPVAFNSRLQKTREAKDANTVGSLSVAAPEGAAAAEFESGYYNAQVNTQATSASFKIPVTASIPSDNAAQKIPITTVKLAMTPQYHATPKLLPGAFLTANVVNTSDFPLLAGQMNVFVDDTFVAASTLRTVMPGEKFDLALGADEGLAVKRKLNNRFTEDTGLVTKGKRITYDITITVQNNKKTAEKIVVTDQIPVSRHEKIVVKLLAPDEREAKPDAEGTIKWTLDLPPGAKRDLPLKFSIEYPNDLPVTGLE